MVPEKKLKSPPPIDLTNFDPKTNCSTKCVKGIAATQLINEVNQVFVDFTQRKRKTGQRWQDQGRYVY
jgi:hypothetical protein